MYRITASNAVEHNVYCHSDMLELVVKLLNLGIHSVVEEEGYPVTYTTDDIIEEGSIRLLEREDLLDMFGRPYTDYTYEVTP